ncbi:CoB--CoM heterodisulfide reductase [Elysia marginata]|uniref:CoB--CoM heterodisulfide reductase n=1 Tax=Elysia marginata TaxID=1093978 RepID=A0AAV4I2E0_9GAST|nr:CoB--CoM heterodisulfide reductase [Elysia marginata]
MLAFRNEGKKPEVLFWVGCAGSFDDKAQRVTRLFANILNKAGVSFGVLGTEESCTGDPAKRAGNEFLFQMQALSNIQTLDYYGVESIVTTCPHCFNTLKNDYPSLGGKYSVFHHTTFIKELLNQGKIKVEGGHFKGEKIVYHDSCYLGRANNVYEAPREILEQLDISLVEMKSCRKRGLCCGAGGIQFFKEAERGEKQIHVERTEQALELNPDIVAVGCSFCKHMLTDGVKTKNMSEKVRVLDILEIMEDAIEKR